jgi:hypothetical protein
MSGSDFSESIKLQARRLAGFRCCYCRERPGDDIHHLTPKEEGGLGTLDNAILLCVQCHADYGHRSDKSKQLRQARDDWHEIVARRYAPVLGQIEAFNALTDNVEQMKMELRRLTETVISRFEQGTTDLGDVQNIASTMISTLSGSTSSATPTFSVAKRARYSAIVDKLEKDDPDQER